ncbi:MAG: PA0069 family radical SAM protein [Alphaproteobacteria bacterium]|nr:MAG: PA0069 family radical SAM protein [Alphaproteobacteria bacterium]
MDRASGDSAAAADDAGADGPGATGTIGTRVVAERRRGRGAVLNPANRYDRLHREEEGDAIDAALRDGELTPAATDVRVERPRRIITRNQSPDISFDRSINPYRGCEHGCVYCYARPSHAYLGLSPGLDFETKLVARPSAPDLLRRELARPGYRVAPIALGTNTDPYQPIEDDWRIMRGLLEVMEETGHPLTIVTKSARITRDIDILARLARRRLVKVAISVTTLDHRLARLMEPRASTPKRRLAAIRALAEAGVPTAVMAAPMIPALNDHEMEAILTAAAEAGASAAGWVLLRMPLEVRDLFYAAVEEWSSARARRVRRILREMRGGRDYDSTFGTRMRGRGPHAALLAQRFRAAVRRLGLDRPDGGLSLTQFRPPQLPTEERRKPPRTAKKKADGRADGQLDLF